MQHPMKRRNIAIATTAVLALAYIAGRLSYPLFDSSEDSSDATSSDSPTHDSPRRIYTIDSSTLEAIDSSPVDELAPPTEIAVADELLLSFDDDASYRNFLADDAQNGLRIIDRNDRLRAARVQSDSDAEAARIRELAGDSATTDYNYLVVAPSIPQPSLSVQPSVPFENRALEWLGVPKDNRSWGEGVTIALMDTGVLDHNILDTDSIERLSLIENSGDPDSEYNSHGTAIASLLVGSQGTGIVPAADIISIQVMDSSGVGDSFTLAAGIVEAVDRGANVISMSLGSYGYTSVLEDAIRYAQSKDVALVASAGNDGVNELTYPARFDGVIGVGAVDTESQRADFSNFSDAVDIAAPGVGVYAAWGEDQWTSFSGTSAAAPYVAGSIAATLSLNPRLSSEQATEIVLNYADDANAPGIDESVGNGTLNMDRVLNRDQPGIYDAALADFHLDFENATETTVPLQVTVQNRGTERLRNVSIQFSENEGRAQRIHLGDLVESETATYTVYLDRDQLAVENGYTVFAETDFSGQDDSRQENNAKSGTLQISTPEE